ncbi:Plasmodium exported protein, unknown function [Plasmodium malariae]|uniref:Fam-l protein n=1 Tax=Plasmodium malariae TaxID=5858 RepID=A0A1D3JHI0_PLAMA|nr:Plasmodium exported protein, unknown function [Plasmodium malariae]SBT85647.1 Plasmodium exported protein, unknown function [Plasmodium malariae]
MKKKFKLFYFIKIVTFIFLTWIHRFNSELSNFCKYLNENKISNEKLCTRTYRLLAKNKKEVCLNILWKTEVIPNNVVYEKVNIYNNKKVSNIKNKLRKKCTSNNLGGYKQAGKCKSSAYNRVDNYYGKKMLDKIYYKNVLRYSRNDDLKFIKKCIQRKREVFFFLFVFHLVVGVSYALLFSVFRNIGGGAFNVNNILKFFVPLQILWIIVLVRLFYILRKTVIYENLLHLKSKFHYTE